LTVPVIIEDFRAALSRAFDGFLHCFQWVFVWLNRYLRIKERALICNIHLHMIISFVLCLQNEWQWISMIWKRVGSNGTHLRFFVSCMNIWEMWLDCINNWEVWNNIKNEIWPT
jgi:hypothetical protein